MNFERNAVESDYDDEYDQKTVYMQEGRAVIVRDAEVECETGTHNIDEYEYRGGYSESQQPATRHRRCVQLPINRPQEQKPEMQVDEKPTLNLPKGGWSVSKINTPAITPFYEVPATLSTKPPSGHVVNRPQSAPRGWNPIAKWKNIPSNTLFATGGLFSEPPPTPAPAKSPYKQEPATNDGPSNGFDKRKNTKICRFVEIKVVGGKTTEINKCRAGGTCTYAHTLASWNPLVCRFQDNCRNFATCSFKHSQETKEAYNDRIKKLGQ